MTCREQVRRQQWKPLLGLGWTPPPTEYSLPLLVSAENVVLSQGLGSQLKTHPFSGTVQVFGFSHPLIIHWCSRDPWCGGGASYFLEGRLFGRGAREEGRGEASSPTDVSVTHPHARSLVSGPGIGFETELFLALVIYLCCHLSLLPTLFSQEGNSGLRSPGATTYHQMCQGVGDGIVQDFPIHCRARGSICLHTVTEN